MRLPATPARRPNATRRSPALGDSEKVRDMCGCKALAPAVRRARADRFVIDEANVVVQHRVQHLHAANRRQGLGRAAAGSGK